mmetsp:Transcript_9587/g.23154  ORF Transcript_9587/g.23154 Transcript_9587/m.23154 type:complete len:303 (+) Transcript_9587:1278-2186(+)
MLAFSMLSNRRQQRNWIPWSPGTSRCSASLSPAWGFQQTFFFGRLVRLLANNLRKLSVQQLGGIMWAVTCTDVRYRPFLESCREFVQEQIQRGGIYAAMDHSQLRMLWQWHQWLELEFSPEERQGLLLTLEARQELRTALERDVDTTESTSSFQKEVEAAVSRLDLGTPLRSVEFVSADAFAIDLALPELKIAIEADGPQHFHRVRKFAGTDGRRDGWTLSGATRLRDRSYEAAGWYVVAVPCFEWKRLSSAEEKRMYMQGALVEPMAARRHLLAHPPAGAPDPAPLEPRAGGVEASPAIMD